MENTKDRVRDEKDKNKKVQHTCYWSTKRKGTEEKIKAIFDGIMTKNFQKLMGTLSHRFKPNQNTIKDTHTYYTL